MTNRAITIESPDGYEHDSVARRVIYRLLVQPILNHLPARSQRQVKSTHKLANDVIEHRATYFALEVLYQGGYRDQFNTPLRRLFHAIWMSTDNAKGVRNRLRLTKREIQKHIEKRLLETTVDEPVRLLSIASGSARSYVAVLDALRDVDRSIDVSFLDKSPAALEYSKMLVAEADLTRHNRSFSWHEDTANNYLRSLNAEGLYDIVEMVGLLDYFSNDKVSSTLSEIYKRLKPGGALIIANIMPNHEVPFVTNVMDWKMIYRTAEEFFDLVSSTNFGDAGSIEAFVEPVQVHVVVKATRPL